MNWPQQHDPGQAGDLPSRDDAMPDAQRLITSDELLCGQREVLITHGDQTYRLRLTRAGKLILQK